MAGAPARSAALHVALAALALAAVPAAAQVAVPGPALAPLTAPLGPSARPDGTEATIRPAFVPAPRLTDATPDSRVGPGAEATVLADQLTLTGDRQLEASGGVVVWYQGTRLVAPRILYDGAADRLRIEGPVHLSRPGDRGTDREAVVIADAASLDGKLREGILRGARLVLARELQLAATQIRVREATDGSRVTVLDRVAASSCRVCAANPTPLWEIRTRRITHDSASHRLTFQRPQFRAFGLPVLALPFAITAPDPTVERMTGFLQPEIRTTSRLGFGVQVPWFRTLGDNADLTLTPYLSVSRTATLNARYRQAFANGALEWRGAVSRDDLKDGTRGYSFAAAEFALPRDFTLGAQLQWTSDRDYLGDYDITDASTLWSGVTLQRVRRDQLIALSAGSYRTLRTGEVQATLPTQVLDAQWQQVLPVPAAIGGRATLGWGVHGHRRPSGLDVIGRDVARASLRLDWQRNDVLPGGVLAEAALRLDADAWQIGDDAAAHVWQAGADRDRLTVRTRPTAGLTLRWPLVRGTMTGADIIEPVLALAWSPRRAAGEGGPVPNEDSLFPELDEGNIYALDRLPGRDRAETGLRGAIGVGWTRLLPDGGSAGLTLAHLWRGDDDGMPASAAPLGQGRHWLLATNVQTGGLAAAGRAVLDEGGDLASGDLRLGWVRPDLQLTAGFAHVAPTDSAARVSQLGIDAGWQVREGLWARATGRYDLAQDQAQKLALGVTWRNECISVEAAVDRDWDVPAGKRPDTGLNLSVRLGGFGRSAQDRTAGTVARRSCMR